MKVLVAGCAGFLGSHFCDKIIAERGKVIGVDNLSTGSKSNIPSGVKFKNKSIFWVDNAKVDYIVNFACPASPKHYQRLARGTMMACSAGADNLLNIAAENGCRIINISTSEVYGDPTEHPQKENHWGNVNPIGERSQYDEGKRFMEALTMVYNRDGVNTGIARLFNSYGSRMAVDDGRAIPQFMTQAIKGEPITIYGDGTQTRSFCYVDDTIDGIYKLMLSDYHLPVNIGSTEEITLNQLAIEVSQIAGKQCEVVYQELPSDDPKQRKPDITLAKNILNWEPKVSRKEGLTKTYEYFKSLAK